MFRRQHLGVQEKGPELCSLFLPAERPALLKGELDRNLSWGGTPEVTHCTEVMATRETSEGCKMRLILVRDDPAALCEM